MSAAQSLLRVFLIDDEPLALKRLARLLRATGRVEIIGSSTDPESTLDLLDAVSMDALFLDIQMPGLNGFELLSRLSSQPLVVFTTAFDQYALRAFEVNSIDYLLKPIEAEHLDRAAEQDRTASRYRAQRGHAGDNRASRCGAQTKRFKVPGKNRVEKWRSRPVH